MDGHRKHLVQRQLDPVTENSSQQRNRHANRYTRTWYCRGQYTVGSGDRIPPQRDTLSCTKSRQYLVAPRALVRTAFVLRGGLETAFLD